MSVTLGVGRMRKIHSDELYHPPYSFSFKLFPVTISASVFSHFFRCAILVVCLNYKVR